LGLDIYHGVDRPGPRWIGSFVKKPTFTRACLFSVRVVVEIMHVPLVDYLCQAQMEWIPALKCLLPRARGCLQSCLIIQVFNATTFCGLGPTSLSRY
jgi:hypothetical protein